MKTNVYRIGRIHVMSKLCETCIFRPGNKMDLEPGRVEAMVKATAKTDGCIPCHTTTYGQDKRGEAACRGFFEKHPTAPLQIAQRLRLITWQEPLEKQTGEKSNDRH